MLSSRGKSGLKKMFWKDCLNKAYPSARPSSVVTAAPPLSTLSAGKPSPGAPGAISAPPHAASSTTGTTADHSEVAGLIECLGFFSLAAFIVNGLLASKVERRWDRW